MSVTSNTLMADGRNPPATLTQVSRSSGKPLDVAAALVLVLLIPITAFGRLSAGAVLAVPLLPLILRSLRHYRTVRLAAALTALSVPAGFVLTYLSLADPARAYNASNARVASALTLAAAVGLVVIVWARHHLTDRTVAFVFALGSLSNAVLSPESFAAAPWKYGYAWPVTVLVLAGFPVRRRGSAAILLALAGISLTQDARSFAAFCVAAAVLMLYGRSVSNRWRHLASSPQRRRRIIRRGAVVSLLLLIVLYQAGGELAIRGWLGPEVQARTALQTDDGRRSVILGGRSEYGAAIALFQNQPIGYGVGVRPSSRDRSIALAGLVEFTGRSELADSEYVQTYLLSDRLSTHSITGDFWLNFGIVGLAAASAWWALLARGLVRRLASPDALRFLLVVAAAWDLAFSPLTSLPHVVLAGGLLASQGKQPAPLPAMTVPRVQPRTGGLR